MLRDWMELRIHNHRASGGFMGREWDSFIPGPVYWREVLRVLKPGGHALVFAAPRTVDLMGLALRISGFELRDCLAWINGQGFPKNHDVSKAIDKEAGAERVIVGKGTSGPEAGMQSLGPSGIRGGDFNITTPATPDAAKWAGFGTALKPAVEPIILARKPLPGTVAETVLEHGTGAINVDGCRLPTADSLGRAVSGWQAGGYVGGKTLKNYDSTNQHRTGRYPANVLLDEQAARVLDEQSGNRPGATSNSRVSGTGIFSLGSQDKRPGHGDSGGASRFFYCSKAPGSQRFIYCETCDTVAEAAERAQHKGHALHQHPTVKPLDVMRWLVRLITPPYGLVLDPFAGSGTTLVAALQEGFQAIGCELDATSSRVILHRLERVGAGVDPAAAESRAVAPDDAPARKPRQSFIPGLFDG
jgi:site-specific DNA-methyltransferase (adenine-specific)